MSAIPATNGQFGVYVRQHAQDVNKRYEDNKANIVTPKQRFNDTLASLPTIEKHNATSKLNAAIRAFRAKYPTIKEFNDPAFRICEALPLSLNLSTIDTTIQRYLSIDWVCDILENFTAYQAMPIQMYKVAPEDVPDGWDTSLPYWAAWDGQHTLVVFYIIAVMIFGQREEDVIIPWVKYNMAGRIEPRLTFMTGNSKLGKKTIEPIDLAMQQIYAVKLDGVNFTDWVKVAEKHDALAANDLFLTSSKFHDDMEPGAVSRTGDIVDPQISVEMVRQFAVYADHVCNHQPRAIDTKELPIILGFLRMAKDCEYTDDEIRSLADLCIQLFDADFNEKGPYWAKVNQAYTLWHNDYYKDMDEQMRPGIRLNKDWNQGGTFMWHQLKKSWKDANGNAMRLPQLNIQTSFYPKTKDLW